jgi:WD40 repeat protein
VACGDQTLREHNAHVWEVATGKPAGLPLRYDRSLLFVNFSDDANRLLTGGWDATARVWDFHSGQAIGPPLPVKGQVQAGAFARGGRWVATSSPVDAFVWSAESGEPLGPPLPLLGQIDRLQFLAANQALVTGTGSRARLWDLRPDDRPPEDLMRLAQLLASHRIDVTGVLEPLSHSMLTEQWTAVSAAYPAQFAWAHRSEDLNPIFGETSLRWDFLRSAAVASTRLGPTNTANGLMERSPADGITEPATMNGLPCRRAVRQPGKGNYIYFAIDPARKSPVPVEAIVEVVYFDAGTGWMLVQYDADPEAVSDHPTYAQSGQLRRLTDSQQWKRAWFRLPWARLANSQNARADFRLAIAAPELCVRDVAVAGLDRVSELPSAPEAPPAGTTPPPGSANGN